MWTCSRCHAENREAAVVCESCGTARPGGRFGSAPQYRAPAPAAPRVSSAPARDLRDPREGMTPRDLRDPRDQEYPRSASRGEYAMPDAEPPRPRRVKKRGCFGARLVGVMLCVLLPLLAALLAWRQAGVLRPMVESLFQIEDTPWLSLACYIAFAVIAGLVALLPGLWTLLLARIAREKRKA